MKLLRRLQRFTLTMILMLIGLGLGVTVLELTLRFNPALIPKGVSPIAAIDPPLLTQTYDISYLDGDAFYWNPELVKPLTAQDNKIQAHVVFETDEFGFPNHGPLPQTVDIVVVGRSYSMGSQTDVSWSQRIRQQTNWKVLNLAQISSGNDVKLHFLQQYGFGRHPRWIIVEVLPLLDIIPYGHSPTLLLPQMPDYVIKGIWSQLNKDKGTVAATTTPIYPLPAKVGEHIFPVVFSTHEMNALTLNVADLRRSQQWALFSTDLLAIQQAARQHSACVAVLFAQSKTGAYLPILSDSDGLKAARHIIYPYVLDSSGLILPSGRTSQPITLEQLQTNAEGMRAFLRDFASQNSLIFIDPTARMRSALAAGNDPFMAYDSHLSSLGHELVAQEVVESLNLAKCG